MARTGLFGGFSFDEEVFTDMMQEQPTWNNAILASGVLVNNPAIMNLIGEKGNVATIPMYKPLSITDAGMAPLNNDGLTDNTPVDIAGKKQTCMLTQIMKAFKAKDFTKELTGADPLGDVKNKIVDYYQQSWIMYLMNIAKATMGVTALASHVSDYSITTGTIADANKIDATTLIYAQQKALGDMADGFGLLVLNSYIFARYKALGLVDYNKYTVTNAIAQDVNLPTIGGLIPIVMDRYTVNTSVAGYPVYSSYILGQGAFSEADKNNYEKQYTTDYDPEASAGTDKFYTKQGKVIHPNGLSLAVDNVAGESPTLAEISSSANWSLVSDAKNVKIGVIKTNG